MKTVTWTCDACGIVATTTGRIPDGWRIIGMHTDDHLDFCGGATCKETEQKNMLRARAAKTNTREVCLNLSNLLCGGIRDMHARLGRALEEMKKVGVDDGDGDYDPYDGGSPDITFDLTCREDERGEIVERIQAALNGKVKTK